jgi:hypothetical protein
LHVVAVLSGVILATVAVTVAALVRGMTWWAALGLAAATVLAAQILYLVWITGMASAEALRRRRAAGAWRRARRRGARRKDTTAH